MGLRGTRYQGNGENYTRKKIMIGTAHSIVKGIKSKRMRWAGHVARMRKKCIKGFARKSWGKKFAGSPRHRWEDNIRKGMGWSVLD